MGIFKDILCNGPMRVIGKLFLSADPTSDLEAATKHYVDQKSDSDQSTIDAKYVKRNGDTMTGLLTLSGAPTANLHAATKQYVDTNRIHVVKGTQTAGTAAWTGEIDVDALYDGLTIAYYLPRAGASGVTLNLTLSGGGTTGAKEVWVSGNTRMSTHYPPGSTVYLTYWSAGSITINGTATTTDRWVGNEYWNSNTIGEYAGACIAGPNGMARYSLIMQVDEDHWESLVTTSTTATTKTKNTSGFLLTSPILYQSAGTYAENGVAGYSGVWSVATGIDLRYSFNCTNAWSSAGRPLYLVGTISGDKFYLKDTTWWADELPSAGDSTYAYWYVGQMQSAYQCTLHPVHPIYIYTNNSWKAFRGDTGITDYNTMLNMTQTGTYPDTTLLRQMCLNFQDGCSELAEAITDAGVTTASNASPTVMATNIATVAENKYNEGYAAGYSHGKSTIIYIDWGSWTGGAGTYTAKTFDITSLYPNYANVSASNMHSFFNRVSGSGGDNFYVRVDSYTASTGSLTLSCNANFKNPQIAVVIDPS